MFHFDNKTLNIKNTQKITADKNKLFGWGGVPNLNERQWRRGATGRISSIFLEKCSSNHSPKETTKMSALHATNDESSSIVTIEIKS